jgi:uncharacterized protein (TIGR02145 family)
MTTKSYFNLRISILFFFSVFLYSGCDEPQNPDEEEWPALAEQIRVDNIGNTTAWFMVDFAGEMLDVSESGFCWGINNPPEITDNTSTFDPVAGISDFVASNLQPSTNYYLRAYYIYNERTYYSDMVSFTTTEPLTDNDGNVYNVIQIGNQLWMGENLKVKTYNNGDTIADGTGRGNYSGFLNPGFYFSYEDEITNSAVYGHLYTWYAATDQRGLCPAGWLLPDVTDWEEMILTLDVLGNNYNASEGGNQEMSPIAGGMLRSTGTLEDGNGLWYYPNEGASNITGMRVVPSGLRDPSGSFDGLGYNAAFWSFSEQGVDNALMFYTHYFNQGIHVNTFSKSTGYAVRCVKNLD